MPKTAKTAPSQGWTVATVIEQLEDLWPESGAEAWDSPGLVVGDPHQRVTSIHLMVDAVAGSIDEALEQGADLIIAHHPLLLRPVTTVAESNYKGSIVSKVIRGGASLYAAHTNADVVPTGTSAVLADALGLKNQVPLAPSERPGYGLGRVGVLEESMSLYELAVALGEVLPRPLSVPLLRGILNRGFLGCLCAREQEILCCPILQFWQVMFISPVIFGITPPVRHENRPCWLRALPL